MQAADAGLWAFRGDGERGELGECGGDGAFVSIVRIVRVVLAESMGFCSSIFAKKSPSHRKA